MESYRNIVLVLAAISFVCVIGAGLYEHVAILPRWASAPPSSLAMFKGKFGVNPGAFWRYIHPVALLLLIVALIMNWGTPRQGSIIITLGGYIVIIAITAIYFVPELMKITSTPLSDTIDASLRSRAQLWEKLSIARLLVMMALSGILLSSLIRSAAKITQ